MPENEIPLVFLHLSDIHFEAQIAGGPDDVDDDIRFKFMAEVASQVSVLGEATGILISGDIASRGSPGDYEYARDWLDQLCVKLGIATESVWTVPGNHDVDQGFQRGNHVADIAREKLLSVDIKDLDNEIRLMHADPTLRDSLYGPIANYNSFASAYDSAIDGVKWRWRNTEFRLNDGSILVLRCVNSALVSDNNDNKRRVLLVGTTALTMNAEPGRLFAFMCHHPPHWLRDQKSIDGPMGRRACLQLFGHEHDQAVARTENTVRVSSGALHPERKGENWKPQYNIISLCVKGTDQNRVLHMEIRSRMWSRQQACFVADDGAVDGHYRYDIPLDAWTVPKIQDVGVASTGDVKTEVAPAKEVGGSMNSAESEKSFGPGATRRLSHRFYRLRNPDQWKVVKALNYLDLQKSTNTAAALFMALFERAKAEHRLAELWRFVENEYHTPADAPNPFEGR